jgi:hypothetical protein
MKAGTTNHRIEPLGANPALAAPERRAAGAGLPVQHELYHTDGDTPDRKGS